MMRNCHALVWLVIAINAAAAEKAAGSAPASPPAATEQQSSRQRLQQQAPQIAFAVRQPGKDDHWYANFSYYAESPDRCTFGEGGRLCVLEVATGKVTTLIDDPEGGVRDPQVHYDGRRILFSYRKARSGHYHLYEINIDGTGLRQLTQGNYDDIEPAYLPDGGIVFVSSRCNRWVNCWLTQVAVLHRMDGDGSNIRALSSNNEHDNTPSVLPDGRVLYTRWEYIDRSQVHYHHLWTMNPDGTSQMVYYGNQMPGVVMIDSRPIPGSSRVLSIFSPGHGMREHDGAVAIIDPAGGPDDHTGTRVINAANHFRDPFPVDRDLFVVVHHGQLVVMDGQGRTEPLFSLPPADVKAGLRCHEPQAVRPRAKERALPSTVDPTQATGRVVLANVYEGRNMAGVKPGEIRKLLVLESLPKPINYTGGMDPLSYGGTFTLERVVGTVPVDEDGSAYVELPALRSFFFVALDEHDMSVKRMQSFLTVQPGEVTSCVGCHEQRTKTYIAPQQLSALRRPPSRVEPIKGVPEVFDYPRDIQPILNDLCAACHGYEKTARGGPHAGRLILTGDHGPMFSHSYYMMTIARLFSDGRNQARSNYPPREIGSSASPILKMLDGTHHGVKATEQQKRMLRLWIESAAAYPGTYAALGTGMIGGYAENKQVDADYAWPTTKAAGAVIDTRCSACHQNERSLPHALADERGVSFWQPNLADKRLKFSRHIVFNLTRPDKSLILLAPLAEQAGGFGICKGADGKPAAVFTNSNDADYRTLLAMVNAGRDHLTRIKRFDMPGFQPREAYLREMRRYGILPAKQGESVPVDPYLLDQTYWRSLWYSPVNAPAKTMK